MFLKNQTRRRTPGAKIGYSTAVTLNDRGRGRTVSQELTAEEHQDRQYPIDLIDPAAILDSGVLKHESTLVIDSESSIDGHVSQIERMQAASARILNEQMSDIDAAVIAHESMSIDKPQSTETESNVQVN